MSGENAWLTSYRGSVSLPTGTTAPVPMLPDATIELGMGAHGEPGLQQLSPPPKLEELVKRMIGLLTDITDSDRSFIPFSQSTYAQDVKDADNEVVLLLNSLGSTSTDVLARVAEVALDELKERGFAVRRVTAGPFVTSLKMSGVGITIWRLPTGARREQAVELWDRAVDTVSWR